LEYELLDLGCLFLQFQLVSLPIFDIVTSIKPNHEFLSYSKKQKQFIVINIKFLIDFKGR
jgi:hypothetical protein